MNKKRFTFLAALLIAVSIFGQLPEKTSILEGNNQKMAPAPAAPEQISYQAVVRDDNNATVANQVVGMQISVLQTTANGTAVYVETQTPTTNANGLLSIYIGAGSAVTATFSVIDWSSGPYFIKIEIDPSGDNDNYTITGTTQLVSVPFAMYAKTSGSSTPGPQGTNGTQGIQGVTGTSGADGATGPSGTTGAQGIQGETGIAGATGSLGAQGDIGATGVAGTNGTDGAQGIQGATGIAGATGSLGAQGDIGATGVAGTNGTNGTDGTQGIQGATGTSGAPGVAGTNGTQGIQGEIGTTGADGAPGIPTGGTEGQVLKMVGGIPVWSDPVQFITFYKDTDGDGYGNNDEQLIVLSGSAAPNGYVSNNTDCNDTDATINPATVWYLDADSDGYGTLSVISCVRPTDGFLLSELSGTGTDDCDDNNNEINPVTVWYLDADGDNYAISTTTQCANPGAGYTTTILPLSDCNDTDVSINPEVTEVLYDGIDNDCNTATLDDDLDGDGFVNANDCNDSDATINPATVWYLDADGDNYAISTKTQCNNPGAGYTKTVLPLGDCNDTDGNINPDVMEVLANGIDDNCDGQVDEVDVGQLRDGGIVFWVDPTDNTLGKVCALEDVSNEDGQTLLNWADAISYSFGYTNSDTGTGVYGDWYLPSKDELRLMYTNLQRFGCSTNTPEGIDPSLCPTRKGEFLNIYYWSSTESNNNNAWYQLFNYGQQISTSKLNSMNVRAVRVF
jgi:hypothetical protein